MSEITIRLHFNLKTGKKDIYVDFESDADALPIEHEEGHRKVIEELLGAKVLKEDEVGEVVVTRGEKVVEPAPAQEEPLPEEPEAQGQ